jgi:hypothetical protein
MIGKCSVILLRYGTGTAHKKGLKRQSHSLRFWALTNELKGDLSHRLVSFTALLKQGKGGGRKKELLLEREPNQSTLAVIKVTKVGRLQAAELSHAVVQYRVRREG